MMTTPELPLPLWAENGNIWLCIQRRRKIGSELLLTQKNRLFLISREIAW
jgi:hypothetical protein